MEHIIQPLMDYLRHHPGIAAVFTFLIAFAESLPLLGTLIPGSVTMTAIGALVGAAVLPASITMIAAACGAFLGDCIGFWLGLTYNHRLALMWPFSRYPHWLENSRDFFKRHGGKSVIIGRFIGPARSTVPMIAGLLQMGWLRFITVAVPSAILWVLVYMVPGIILGALSLEFPPKETTTVLLIGLVVIVAIWFVFWAIQYFFRRIASWLAGVIARCWQRWPTKAYYRHLIHCLVNPLCPEDHRSLTLLLLACVSGVLLVTFIIRVILGGVYIFMNQPLYYLIQSIRTPLLDKIFVSLTLFGSPIGMVLIGILAGGILWIYQQRRACYHLWGATIAGSVSAVLCKWLVYSPRPAGIAKLDLSSSFPSGHTVMSVVVLGFLAYLVSSRLPATLRSGLVTTVSVVLLLVGFSRLYVGAHWLTDVLSGVCLGLFILLLAIISYRRKSPVGFAKIKPWEILTVLSIIVIWSTLLIWQYPKAIKDYSPFWLQQTFAISDWRQHPTQSMPLYRNNRLGQPAEPFNIQWVGGLAQIKEFLLENDWHPLEHSSKMKTNVQRFLSYAPEHHLPLWPLLYRGKEPALFFIKRVNNKRDIIELRLWESGVNFRDSSLPLWIGVITYHSPPQQLIYFKKHHDIVLQSAGSLISLFGEEDGFSGKLVTVSKYQLPATLQDKPWDGQVLIVQPASYPIN